MDESKLLEQLLAEQKKSTKSHLLLTILLAVLTAMMGISLAILVPRAVSTLDRADRELDQLETTLGDIDDMVENANGILEENETGLSQSVEAIASIDIDSLNSSIQELAAILSPLAKLLGN